MQPEAHAGEPHSISIVIPVYRGATTLRPLMEQIAPLSSGLTTPGGHQMVVREVLLVDDNGPDGSGAVMRSLADRYPWVRTVWLSRNFGQHAATLAGMASSTADWIVTLDEDGQHDPDSIADMLDVALDERAAVVYAEPQNAPPAHGVLRNATSRTAKWVFLRLLSSGRAPNFHSFRLVLGDVGRSVAAYAGAGIYLDVALGWVTTDFASCPVVLREEGGRPSGYSFRSLLSHFWRLVLTSGTRPMRIVSIIGAVFACLGFVAAAVIFVGRIVGAFGVDGWASLSIVMLVGVGLVLFSLGIVAEYVGVAATMAMGKPPFLIVSDREHGPLGRIADRS